MGQAADIARYHRDRAEGGLRPTGVLECARCPRS